MSPAFRLAAVLRYRERAEETRALVLAVALRAQAAAAERHAALVREIGACRDALRIAGARGATGQEIRDLDDAAAAAARESQIAAAELGQMGERVDAARQDLLRAARDRRALERLRGIERDAYGHLRARAEQALLDELGGLRHARHSAVEASR